MFGFSYFIKIRRGLPTHSYPFFPSWYIPYTTLLVTHFSGTKSHSSNLPFTWIQSTDFPRPPATTFDLVNVRLSVALLIILCLPLWLYSFVNHVFTHRFDCIIIVYRWCMCFSNMNSNYCVLCLSTLSIVITVAIRIALTIPMHFVIPNYRQM